MRLVCAAAIFFFCLSLQAQDCKVLKGYAYQRSTIPGNIPRRDLDESGREIDRPVKMLNTLFIYLETDKGCNLQVTKLSIAGKVYRVKQEEIKDLPVVIHHSHPGTPPDTLVRQTNRKVFRIQPAGDVMEEERMTEAKPNDPKIIIDYTNKKRRASYKIHEVKRIAPMVLQ